VPLVWTTLIFLTAAFLSTANVPDDIAQTDEKVRQIDRLQTAEIKKSLNTGTDRGGTLSAYLHEGQIRHLKVNVGMSNRDVEKHFYYESGQLILATSRQAFSLWDSKTQKLDALATSSIIEDRYYFQDGKLRHWNTSRIATAFPNQNEDFTQKEKIALKEASFFSKTVRDQNDKVNIERFIKQGIP
jgi:hypothetical protein